MPKQEAASMPKPEKSEISNLVAFRGNGLQGYFDTTSKQFAITPQFENAHEFAANGLALVQKNSNDKYGYIDAKGQVVIPLQFEDAGDFAANGLAYVMRDRKYGYIDAKGQVVIALQFEYAGSFAANGLARVKQDSKWIYIDARGQVVKGVLLAANGLGPAMQDRKYGYIDAKGQVVIPLQFEDAGDFAANGLAPVKQDSKWGYIDAKGQMVIPLQFVYANDFGANGLAFVRLDEKNFAKIDTKGKKIVYDDSVCDTPVVKNSDDQVVWPKKPVADICAEAEYARNREHESRVRDSIDSANREASYRAYQQCKVEMDSCYLRTNGKGNCYRDCDRLR